LGESTGGAGGGIVNLCRGIEDARADGGDGRKLHSSGEEAQKSRFGAWRFLKWFRGVTVFLLVHFFIYLFIFFI